MISFVMEAEEEKPYTKADVRRGYGKLLGGIVGNVPGTIIGSLAADATATKEDQKIKADISKASQRVGLSVDEGLRAKRLAKGAGIGAGTGALLGAAGAIAHSIDDKDWENIDPPNKFVSLGSQTALGTLGGAALGAGIAQLVGHYKAMKKMGYGKVGKTLGITTPLAAITKPKALRDKEKK